MTAQDAGHWAARARSGIGWALAAMLGIALTVVLTWAVSRLAGQRIGLSSAPLSVVRGLAPAAAPAEPSSDRDRTAPAVPGAGGTAVPGAGGTAPQRTTATRGNPRGRDDAGDSGGGGRGGGGSGPDD